MLIRIKARRRVVLGGGGATALALSLGLIICGPIAHTRASAKAYVPESVQSAAPRPLPAGNSVVLASPGRIEAKSDTFDVGAGMDGVIQWLFVREGQNVVQGQALAQLDCRDLQSALSVSKSEAESLRQVRARLMVGSRPEERQAAAEQSIRAKAEMAHAATQFDRQRQLAEARAVSRAALDDARRDAEVAESEYQLALRHEALVNAAPVTEDLAKADADVEAAERRIALAEEKLSKCVIRAPMAGTILRVLLHPGESFALVAPRPILTMADLSGRRVRAEVDENDIGKVHLGQSVTISIESLAGQSIHGKVTQIASVMGRKSIVTGDPADKSDRDILEVTAELESAAIALPVGLRTTVVFLP